MTKPVCAVVGIGPQNGASFARRFASEGYTIALLSRKTEYSSKLAAEIDSAKVYACDVTVPSAVETAFAAVRADMGEIDLAFEWLEKGYNNHEIEMYWLKVEPPFEPIRSDPRWQTMLDKIGYPD